MNGECPFCDYAGPSEILYDGLDHVIFEPLDPVTPGHVLVVPRVHVRDAVQAPWTGAKAFNHAALWAGQHEAANIITSIGKAASQTVEHLHIHVVPRREGDGLALPWTRQA